MPPLTKRCRRRFSPRRSMSASPRAARGGGEADTGETRGGGEPAPSKMLGRCRRYCEGVYKPPATFQAIRKELGSAQRPAHYLAIPPPLFELVVEQLAKSGSTKNA